MENIELPKHLYPGKFLLSIDYSYVAQIKDFTFTPLTFKHEFELEVYWLNAKERNTHKGFSMGYINERMMPLDTLDCDVELYIEHIAQNIRTAKEVLDTNTLPEPVNNE